MNRDRRKRINELYQTLSEAADTLQTILDEEEEYRDNIPDNLQGSERYERAEESCNNLDNALYSLNEVFDYLLEAI